MGDQALRLGGGTLARYAEIVHTALIEMRGTTAPRLVLELLCARMMLPDAANDAAAVLQRVERLERRLTAAGTEASPEPVGARQPSSTVAPRVAQRPAVTVAAEPPKARAEPAQAAPAQAAPDKAARQKAEPEQAVPAQVASEKAAPEQTAPEQTAPAEAVPAKAAAGAAESPKEQVAPARAVPAQAAAEPAADPGALDAAALRRLWPEVLEIVKQASRRTRALLDNAQISGVAGELVTLSAPKALAKMIADDSNTSVLRAALTKIVGGEWKVTVEGGANGAAEATSGRTPAEPEPDPRDEPDYQAAPAPAAAPADAETAAMRLLQDQLDARPLDG
jgi:DNA polymerase-3 subunit gamma/tau